MSNFNNTVASCSRRYCLLHTHSHQPNNHQLDSLAPQPQCARASTRCIYHECTYVHAYVRVNTRTAKREQRIQDTIRMCMQRDTHLSIQDMALLLEYSPHLIEYRALLMEYWALSISLVCSSIKSRRDPTKSLHTALAHSLAVLISLAHSPCT